MSKSPLYRLIKYISKHFKKLLIIIIISIIISSICHVYGQLFLQVLIDDYLTPLLKDSNPVFTPLLKAVGWMSFVYLIGVIATFIYSHLTVYVSQGVLKIIRNTMFSHMETLPIRYFDENTHGNIMSYYLNDTDTLRELISESLPDFIANGLILIAAFIAMLSLNVFLTIMIILGVLIMLLIANTLNAKASTAFFSRQKSVAEVNGYLEEMIAGQKVVQVFNHEQAVKENFDLLNEELFKQSKNADLYANILMPIMGNIGYLIYVLIAIFGGIIAIKTTNLTIGEIASFLLLTRSFTMHTNQLSQIYTTLAPAFAGAKRIFQLIDEQSEENKGLITLVNVTKDSAGHLTKTKEHTNHWAWYNPQTQELIELKGNIEFRNVTFSYQKNKKVLENISLKAKEGQKIALVGATGAGKTTIANLINCFYDLDEGLILYDGIDIRQINKKDLRKSLGMVLQDVFLFTGTIMDNLRYGKQNATEDECRAASKLANATSFIEKLPDGYNTFISNNGDNLSQGERQLLSIARCAVSNPPVMILDEATSSIDTQTEKIIQEGMDKLMQNRTVFVIAHRLSTIRNASLIVVLEHGKIIEQGTHEQLIKKKGKYYELYTGAFELE